MGELSALSAGDRIALDTVILVYFLETHPDFGPLVSTLFERIEEGELTAVASSLVLTELLVPLYKLGEMEAAQALADAMLQYPNLTILPATTEIATRAAELRGQLTLRAPDAIHAATALVSDASVFITNDRRLRSLERVGMSVHLLSETR